MTTIIFGSKWDAPICEGDDVEVVPAPVGTPCIDCAKPILEGENGRMMPVVTASGAPGWSSDEYDLEPQHKECMLLSVVGHSYEICRCTNYGGTGSRRAGAVRLWELIGAKS